MGGRTERRITARIISAILILGAVLYAPHWTIPATMALVCVFSFDDFYEILFAGFLIDVIYGSPIAWAGGFSYMYTLFALLVFLGVGSLKTRLSINVFQN